MATFCDINNCNQLSFRTDKNTRKHYCRSHYQFHSTDLDKRSITAKALSRGKVEKIQKEPRFKKAGFFDISKVEEELVSGVSVMDEGEIEAIRKSEMDLFWKNAERVIAKKPYCWECNDYIAPNDYRAATAHIFPKSLFPSIAANEFNYLVLGSRCGCHNLSHRLDTFSQMKVFPTAINRFMKFGHLITEKHKYLTLFKEYANERTIPKD
jgi:hypothetical protein